MCSHSLSHVSVRTLPAPNLAPPPQHVSAWSAGPGGAIDWAWRGLVALGTREGAVLLVDAAACRLLHALLGGHRPGATVTHVRWQRLVSGAAYPPSDSHCHSSGELRTLLASADADGVICVWDALQAQVTVRLHAEVPTPGGSLGAVTQLQWLHASQDHCTALLASYATNVIALWDTASGQMVWTHSFGFPVVDFDLDPFNSSRLIILSSTCVALVDDLSVSRSPSAAFSTVALSALTGEGDHSTATTFAGCGGGGGGGDLSARGRLWRALQVMTGVDEVGCSSPGSPAGTSSDQPLSPVSQSGVTARSTAAAAGDLRRLLFVPSCRDQLLLLGCRQLLLYDLQLGRLVRSVPVGGGSAAGGALVSLLPLVRSAALLCVTDCGGVQLRRPALHCVAQSELARASRQWHVVAAAADPLSEQRCAVLLSDGRLLFWDVLVPSSRRQLAASQIGEQVLRPLRLPASLSRCRLLLTGLLQCGMPPNVLQSSSPPCSSVSSSLWSSASTSTIVCSLQMCPCPPSVVSSSPQSDHCQSSASGEAQCGRRWRPLLACGTRCGHVLLLDMAEGRQWRRVHVHSWPVAGVHWVGATALLSHASWQCPPTAAATGQWRNELVYTSGLAGGGAVGEAGVFGRRLRTDAGCQDRCALACVRVSTRRQYAVLVFDASAGGGGRQPAEIWCLATLALLRVLPDQLSAVTALHWAPHHTAAARSRNCNPPAPAALVSGSAVPPPSLFSSATAADSEATSAVRRLLSKEHLLLGVEGGGVFHLAVEGRLLADGTRLPLASGHGPPRALAWCVHCVAVGHSDGTLTVHNLTKRHSRVLVAPSAGVVTGAWLHLRFAPQSSWPCRSDSQSPPAAAAESQLLALSVTGVLHVHRVLTSSGGVAAPSAVARWRGGGVLDADWASRHCVVLLLANGTIHVTDSSLCVTRGPLPRHPCLYCVPGGLHSLSCRDHWTGVWQRLLPAPDVTAATDVTSASQCTAAVWRPLEARLTDACVFERGVCAALLAGDEGAFVAWRVAAHHVHQLQLCHHCQSTRAHRTRLSRHFVGLDLDALCDSAQYRRHHAARVRVHLSRAAPGEVGDALVDELIVLGETERAVELLLQQEERQTELHYSRSLLACVLAAQPSDTPAQANGGRTESGPDPSVGGGAQLWPQVASEAVARGAAEERRLAVLRMAATGLVASGQVERGVQLLVAARLVDDAVRYLLNTERWREAVHLAHCRLPAAQVRLLLGRCAAWHTGARPTKSATAALSLLAAAQWQKAARLLLPSVPSLSRVLTDITPVASNAI